jgi:hypothetical protein
MKATIVNEWPESSEVWVTLRRLFGTGLECATVVVVVNTEQPGQVYRYDTYSFPTANQTREPQ